MNDEKPLRFAMTYGKLLIAGEGDGGKRTEKGLSSARGSKGQQWLQPAPCFSCLIRLVL